MMQMVVERAVLGLLVGPKKGGKKRKSLCIDRVYLGDLGAGG